MTSLPDIATDRADGYAVDRAERYELRKLEEREDGSVVGEMVVATVGPMQYAHGVDFVPRETLADEAAIESLRLRPMIGPDTHTPDAAVVQPHEIAERRIGHVGSNVRMEGDDLVADFVIDTPAGKALLEKGLRAVSPGYTVSRKKADPGSGADFVQDSRRYLHVALVEKARGGDRVRIVDSVASEVPVEFTPEMIASLAAALKPLIGEEMDACMARNLDGYAAKMADMMKPPPQEEQLPPTGAEADGWTVAETRKILDLADVAGVTGDTVTDLARAVAAKSGVAADASGDTLRGFIAGAKAPDGWTVRKDTPAVTPIPLVGFRPTVKE
jgi:hypothetical protein